MPIVSITESLLRRSTVNDGSILRDRVLCGFCVRMNARRRTFKVHSLRIESPFNKLAAAGLMAKCTQPRAHVLQVADLPAWKAAVFFVNYFDAQK